MKRWVIRSLMTLGLLLGGVMLMVWLLWIPSEQEPPYRFTLDWGGKGSNPGQFHDPTGIAVTADEVFVSDSRNGRIQVFDHGGRFLRQFGASGDKPGQLGRPMNLSIYENTLYIADYWNDRWTGREVPSQYW
ncbi:MAG: hypothetical protein JKY67_04415 [Pseudomonadales bacterium]|nr:hypothetical protein [Pseudomonadales bacterium]